MAMTSSPYAEGRQFDPGQVCFDKAASSDYLDCWATSVRFESIVCMVMCDCPWRFLNGCLDLRMFAACSLLWFVGCLLVRVAAGLLGA